MAIYRYKNVLLFLLLWCLIASPAAYYAFKQARENSVLQSYLDQLALDMKASPWENAKHISSQLRQDFVIDETQFKHLDLGDRPFLRETSDYLLEIKEGLCGEGTRVLVNLLLLAGYDATRISLYDRYLNSSHTLASLRVGDNEYLIDSINTPDYTNNYINNNQINATSFNIVKYSGDFTQRMDAFNEAKQRNQQSPLGDSATEEIPSVEERFYNRFLYYSYEALPYTKLASAFNLDTRVLNFDRPPRFLSSLAEKPYQIMVFFWLLLATGVTLLLASIGAVVKLTKK